MALPNVQLQGSGGAGGNAEGGTVGPTTFGAVYQGLQTSTVILFALGAFSVWWFFIRKK